MLKPPKSMFQDVVKLIHTERATAQDPGTVVKPKGDFELPDPTQFDESLPIINRGPLSKKGIKFDYGTLWVWFAAKGKNSGIEYTTELDGTANSQIASNRIDPSSITITYMFRYSQTTGTRLPLVKLDYACSYDPNTIKVKKALDGKIENYELSNVSGSSFAPYIRNAQAGDIAYVSTSLKVIKTFRGKLISSITNPETYTNIDDVPLIMYKDAATADATVTQDVLDVYGEGKTTSETLISNCRVSLRTVYSGTNNGREVVSNATVIFMNGYSEPFYKFTDLNQGDKLVFNGKEYTITTINRDIEPFTSQVYQYKVGVI